MFAAAIEQPASPLCALRSALPFLSFCTVESSSSADDTRTLRSRSRRRERCPYRPSQSYGGHSPCLDWLDDAIHRSHPAVMRLRARLPQLRLTTQSKEGIATPPCGLAKDPSHAPSRLHDGLHNVNHEKEKLSLSPVTPSVARRRSSAGSGWTCTRKRTGRSSLEEDLHHRASETLGVHNTYKGAAHSDF